MPIATLSSSHLSFTPALGFDSGGAPVSGVARPAQGTAAVASPTINLANPSGPRHPPVTLHQQAIHGADLWAWEAGPGPGPPDPFHGDWKHWRDRSGGDDDDECGGDGPTQPSLEDGGHSGENTGGDGR